MNDDELRRVMEQEARDAENAPDEDDGQPLPGHVKLSRSNRARSKVLQVRLNPEEFEAVERLAAERGLPASTLARGQLLQMVAEANISQDEALAQLNAAIRKIHMLVDSGLVVAKTVEHTRS